MFLQLACKGKGKRGFV